MARAVVAFGVGAPLEVREVEAAPLSPSDVRVEIAAAGVCHSDLSMLNGTIPCDFPLILGHEAAGTIVEVGRDVTLAVGQPVVLNWAPPCRACAFCLRGEPWLCAENAGVSSRDRGVKLDGAPVVSTLGVGAFTDEVVLPATSVVPISRELPLESAALLGCAVLTGVGAVQRTAHVVAGESVAVIGLGGVGLSVLAGARLAGAHPVIAVDRVAEKEPLARGEGATEFVVSDEELARRIRALTEGRGADHVFDCVGSAATIRTAWQSARRGGKAVVVGVGGRDEAVSFNALELFHFARTLTSSVFGSSDPAADLPGLVDAVLAGEIDPARFVTHRCGLDGVTEAFDRMAQGIGGRTLVTI